MNMRKVIKNNKIEIIPSIYVLSNLPQVATNENESGRSFPGIQYISDTYHKDHEEFTEISEGNDEDSSEYDADHAGSNSDIHHKHEKWNRLGETIDRQFEIFSGIFNLASVGVSNARKFCYMIRD